MTSNIELTFIYVTYSFSLIYEYSDFIDFITVVGKTMCGKKLIKLYFM